MHQVAEPVAGSSGMPMLGPKNRETKTAAGQRGDEPAAVTMNLRRSTHKNISAAQS